MDYGTEFCVYETMMHMEAAVVVVVVSFLFHCTTEYAGNQYSQYSL